jgi:hypothetical protein
VADGLGAAGVIRRCSQPASCEQSCVPVARADAYTYSPGCPAAPSSRSDRGRAAQAPLRDPVNGGTGRTGLGRPLARRGESEELGPHLGQLAAQAPQLSEQGVLGAGVAASCRGLRERVRRVRASSRTACRTPSAGPEHCLDLGAEIPVRQLRDVVVARRLVRPGGGQPAEEDVAVDVPQHGRSVATGRRVPVRVAQLVRRWDGGRGIVTRARRPLSRRPGASRRWCACRSSSRSSAAGWSLKRSCRRRCP